ncbi:MAG: LysM peptidoglycan-binding domain-containing protein [Puniceicoccales bacterium]|jgi:LysM repeat protein|nr:LysM peptidoglycan-binding domain-containing protein [Puniceicoccales bacterium]
MKLRNTLGACVLAILPFLTGCAVVDWFRSDSCGYDRRNDNVAYSISPEVASNGGIERRRPTRPGEIAGVQCRDRRQGSTVGQDSISVFYYVQSGDSVQEIARKLVVPPSAITGPNGINRNTKLIPGQRLEIEITCPARTQSVSVAQHADGPCRPGSITYAVKAGDSLHRIAQAHGTSAQTLMKVNNLSSDMLFVGQKLCIPEPQRSGETPARNEQISSGQVSGVQTKQPKQLSDDGGKYVVKSGDSLYLIAKRFGVTQSDLQRVNSLDDPNLLQIGQKLIIPAKKEGSPSAPSSRPAPRDYRSPLASTARGAKPPASQVDPDNLYTIRSGDTISQIANELRVDRGDLMDLNNLTATSPLRPGKKLLIPQTRKASSERFAAQDDDFFDNFDDIPVVEMNN